MIKKKMIGHEENGMRFDRWMKKHYPHLSYSLLQKLIRKGQIRINSGRIKTSTLLSTNDEVRLPPLDQEQRDAPARTQLSPREEEALQSFILFETDAFFVINKPSGLAVQGGTNQRDSLDVLYKCLPGYEEARLTHRLDKETSGLLVFAKSMQDAAWITNAFKERAVEKIYHAITSAPPPQSVGCLEGALQKYQQKVMIADEDALDAKEATTNYRILKQHISGLTWIELCPLTGRMHQLRVHCAANGFPILGDNKYFEEEYESGGRLCLHAFRLSFTTPKGERLQFEAPYPPHMQEKLEKLGLIDA
jgi:23S rRNA pseudouridine955/2504/2580 synthase